eukprot:TRINITY_DN7092_c0_g1_i2.p1 TRINITY_DN7092_c0_g1~~TRINITY_DN7092_c0_g1_i2.p1  ORF type:complete len:635 (+),score=137.79 TRINITY_DN7092_c0_g1_i2:240-2144(+)
MSRINVLPESISNKIAAGEVIERPASVVKELVENSIDSGATRISVNIEQGGVKLISVTDNGSGMDKDDAIMCFEPHATSKIAKDEDIFNILSFGFRGEAIPSIASISRFTLRTRTHDALEGTEVYVQGGRMIKEQPMGCAPGTEIIIRDLFFNTPARKKFLRAQSTEEKHIQESLMMLSLPYPQITFELFMDGRRVFSSAAHDTLTPRLKTYFGSELADNLMPVSFSDSETRIDGFIARHGFSRNSRREQRVFVNGRPVEALAVYNGIREGYGSLVDKGRFPPVVLFLRVDPQMVDVNVHPAKREVRLRKSRNITNAVCEAIRMVLRNSSAPTVSVDSSLSLKNILDGVRIDYAPREENLTFEFHEGHDERRENQPVRPVPSFRGFPASSVFARQPQNEAETMEATPEDTGENTPSVYAESPDQTPSAAVPPSPDNVNMIEFTGFGDLQILGFLDRTYILCVAANGMVIIDQHAAHERVMYEKLLKAAEDKSVLSQQLLLPVTVELSRSEAAFVEKRRELFESLGFDVEALGDTTVMVNAIPASMHQNNAGTVIKDMLSDLVEDGRVNKDLDLAAVARASCIAAVKAHDRLTFEEARSLLRQMARCELPYSCPHGRPTVINVSYKELEKRFGRR